jgi:hypothetical protein
MCRLNPLRTRRFVLASGDAIAFNTIVRDRNVTWPIQDLPCSLVLFCHNNPVGDTSGLNRRDSASGTEDLLLYQDIIEALRLAVATNGKLCDNAEQLAAGLRSLRVHGGKVTAGDEGPLLFDPAGNRQSGTGEHVVWLRPHFVGERVLPEATVTVAAWDPAAGDWKLRSEPMRILYTGAPPE